MSVGSVQSGDPLDRFEVEREVGRGAAGIVYRATDREGGGAVALKVIAQQEADPDARARFLEEGALISEIDHPGIIRIVEFGTLGSAPVELAGQRFDAETPFIAMEWLDGSDLERRQADQGLSLPASLECARQVADALSAAHARGIIHRDVKPSNVFMVEAPPDAGEVRVKLVDFGVATRETQDAAGMGAMVGTPAYMAPEQARGTTIDARCDVYSLGATLFELIAGRPPHTGATPIATLAKLVSTPAQRLSDLVLDVPDALDQLVAEMLALESDGRPYSSDVAERLAAIGADPNLPKLANAIERQHDSVHSSVSRLVTTLVALGSITGERRETQLASLRERGAEAVQLGTDSAVAYLGARRAHGREASLAIELGKELAAEGARVGVATGRALVAMARPVGEVVDRASAMARGAKPGELYSDETTAELARGTFEFTRGPISGWVVGERVPERRQQVEVTPFVGRGGELELLSSAFDRSLDERQPVVVSVSGPPGIGKSRLAREFVCPSCSTGASPNWKSSSRTPCRQKRKRPRCCATT